MHTNGRLLVASSSRPTNMEPLESRKPPALRWPLFVVVVPPKQALLTLIQHLVHRCVLLYEALLNLKPNLSVIVVWVLGPLTPVLCSQMITLHRKGSYVIQGFWPVCLRRAQPLTSELCREARHCFVPVLSQACIFMIYPPLKRLKLKVCHKPVNILSQAHTPTC